ncbi:ankyrin repeat protein [Reticulomyxa filosa]|uniref:Ankyrin repeat protein n=1 Tax=Reticulomyxa filosa TaxID=46433 RepID=X6N3R3_RETFI|nr:ankyrin repeat protein [Reticulomyxa filosa]|eukprot:ETO20905.1 ankyrin repeat protein [Reticulomyxa filosa]
MGSICCKEGQYEPIEQIPQDWSSAVTNGETTGVQYLHADDPSLVDKPVDKQGRKALHIAAANNYVEIVEYLLANGANVNAVAPRTGDTALHEAARINAIPVIRLLLQNGGNPNIANRKRQKPQEFTEFYFILFFAYLKKKKKRGFRIIFFFVKKKIKIKQYRNASSTQANISEEIRIRGLPVKQFVMEQQQKEKEEMTEKRER